MLLFIPSFRYWLSLSLLSIDLNKPYLPQPNFFAGIISSSRLLRSYCLGWLDHFWYIQHFLSRGTSAWFVHGALGEMTRGMGTAGLKLVVVFDFGSFLRWWREEEYAFVRGMFMIAFGALVSSYWDIGLRWSREVISAPTWVREEEYLLKACIFDPGAPAIWFNWIAPWGWFALVYVYTRFVAYPFSRRPSKNQTRIVPSSR